MWGTGGDDEEYEYGGGSDEYAVVDDEAGTRPRLTLSMDSDDDDSDDDSYGDLESGGGPENEENEDLKERQPSGDQRPSQQQQQQQRQQSSSSRPRQRPATPDDSDDEEDTLMKDDGADLTKSVAADPIRLLNDWFIDRLARHPRRPKEDVVRARFSTLLDLMGGLSHAEQQRVVLCEDALYIPSTKTRAVDTTIGIMRLLKLVHELLGMSHQSRLTTLARIAERTLERADERLRALFDPIPKDKQQEFSLQLEEAEPGTTEIFRHGRVSYVKILSALRRIEMLAYNMTTRTTRLPLGPLTPEKRAEIERNRAYRREKAALEQQAKLTQHARYSKERAYRTKGDIRPRENGARYVSQLGNVW